jgi:hypothetical protein
VNIQLNLPAQHPNTVTIETTNPQAMADLQTILQEEARSARGYAEDAMRRQQRRCSLCNQVPQPAPVFRHRMSCGHEWGYLTYYAPEHAPSYPPEYHRER